MKEINEVNHQSQERYFDEIELMKKVQSPDDLGPPLRTILNLESNIPLSMVTLLPIKEKNEYKINSQKSLLEIFSKKSDDLSDIENEISEVLLPIKDIFPNDDLVSSSQEKPKRKSFYLFQRSLPFASQLTDQQLMLDTLQKGDFSCFIDLFKNEMNIEHKVSLYDLERIILRIVQMNALSTLPEICEILYGKSYYSPVLSKVFIEHQKELKSFKDIVLNCLWSMMKNNKGSTFTDFIEACLCVNDWNRIWSGVLSEDPNYKFDEKYFRISMAIFQSPENHSFIINQDTMMIIIPYVMKHYPDHCESYISDIWIYCVSKSYTSAIDFKIPEQIFDKIIEKLILLKNPLFSFIMKLLSKNWTLLSNKTFSTWFSQMVSDKSDSKRCLQIIKESITSKNKDNIELHNNFLLLVINVMSYLNKKFLFSCSKDIFAFFLQKELEQLNLFLSTHNDKFVYKWTLVDCLISLAEYQNALNILREFDVLKDLENGFTEYRHVKEVLLKLVWHLLYIKNTILAIDFLKEFFSIFITNVDTPCMTDCSEIFDFIILKLFESNDVDVTKKMISLFDFISGEDIEFNITKESLRYLIVAAVRSNVSFSDLLDLVDTCFRVNIFEKVQTAEDGLGSFVNVYSNFTVEEVSILVTWLCRQVKVKLVDLAQRGINVKGDLLKICSMEFILRRGNVLDEFCEKVGAAMSFSDFVVTFTESLTSPKYLSCPITFSVNNDVNNETKITCDNRAVYNAVYYSDI